MPRNGRDVRRRLQFAALELFRDRGYELTTAAEIAARAGVPERTFFRPFPAKREALSDGEALLSEALTKAVRNVPVAFGPWEALFSAFRALEPLFVENRSFSEPRHRIIESSPALRERELAKVRSLVGDLTSALIERGVPTAMAGLAAQVGMVALGQAISAWLDGAGELDDHLVRAFQAVRELAVSQRLGGSATPG